MPAELPPGLLEEYLANTRTQMRLLAGLADRLAAAGNDVAALDQLRGEAHKVRGTAGSYGFGAASRLAAGMEATARDWVARPNEADMDRAAVARWFMSLLGQALELEAPRSRPPESVPTAVSHANVIVVDDDPALTGLLEYWLRARGYRFAILGNGAEALDALLALDRPAEHPLLLVDVDVPAPSGYAVLEALQRESPGRFRVVCTTVSGDESGRLRGLRAGAVDYLVKPISLRIALERIRRWVGK